MSLNNEKGSDFVSVVGYLLGFRNDSTAKLLDNENTTARQRENASISNIENVCVHQRRGAAEQWEAGALTDVISQMKVVKDEAVLMKLKQQSRKRSSVPVDGDKMKQTTLLVVPQQTKASDNNSPYAKMGQGAATFFPPRKVVVKSEIESGKFQRQIGVTSSDRIYSEPPNKTNNTYNTVPNHKPLVTSLFNTVGNTQPKTLNSDPTSSQVGSAGNRFLEDRSESKSVNPFKTAHEQLQIDDKRRGIQRSLPSSAGPGVHVSGLRRPKVEPARVSEPKEEEKPKFSDNPEVEEIMSHESMSNIDPKMVEAILNEVVQATSTTWEDIAGLEGVKAIIREVIIWPMRRPDIFTGLRASPRGILFFGPPGTGKTMFGRVIANQFNSTFFNISASSLTSKWIGEGEKMVRALFAVARVKQPSVIFIDEIDSILTQRSDTEHESSRRLKTEFLIQFDGCATQSEERILVIGVTNRPQELDEAARRRFVKRIYIPLPDREGRKQLVRNLLKKYTTELSEEDFNSIAEMTEGYSGADMNSLSREAAYGPIREICHLLDKIDVNEVRPMQMKDFVVAQRQVKSSVAISDVKLYEEWDSKFGCHI